MEILKVSPEDASELLEIYSPYVMETAVSFEHTVPTLDEFRKRIIDISSKYPYIKAVEDGKIIGYAYANTFKGRVSYNWSVETSIYVYSNRKREGIGQKLYSVLEQSLSEMNIQNVNACIVVPNDEDTRVNLDSFHFHEKMGFSLVGTFHKCGMKFGKWYNMAWMEKSIGCHPENPPEILFGKWEI